MMLRYTRNVEAVLTLYEGDCKEMHAAMEVAIGLIDEKLTAMYGSDVIDRTEQERLLATQNVLHQISNAVKTRR